MHPHRVVAPRKRRTSTHAKISHTNPTRFNVQRVLSFLVAMICVAVVTSYGPVLNIIVQCALWVEHNAYIRAIYTHTFICTIMTLALTYVNIAVDMFDLG